MNFGEKNTKNGMINYLLTTIMMICVTYPMIYYLPKMSKTKKSIRGLLQIKNNY